MTTVKVLVVDDEPITRQVVCKQLEKLGYDRKCSNKKIDNLVAKSATGGTDALKKLEIEDFHLMIGNCTIIFAHIYLTIYS